MSKAGAFSQPNFIEKANELSLYIDQLEHNQIELTKHLGSALRNAEYMGNVLDNADMLIEHDDTQLIDLENAINFYDAMAQNFDLPDTDKLFSTLTYE